MWSIAEGFEHDGTPCWRWDGAVNGEGYAQAWDGERQVGAHRLVYERLVRPVPAGLELDHLCRRRWCVNPAHLEPVTHRENIMRSPIAPAAINAHKAACSKGHPLTPDNVLSRRGRVRDCKTCHRDRECVRRAAQRGAA